VIDRDAEEVIARLGLAFDGQDWRCPAWRDEASQVHPGVRVDLARTVRLQRLIARYGVDGALRLMDAALPTAVT
jgi:hypothetical protein